MPSSARILIQLSAALGVLAAACSSESAEPEAGQDASASDAGSGAAEQDEAGSADARMDAPDAGLCTTCGACDERVRITSAQHLPEPIDYDDVPPAGGDHAACWTTFGVHATEVPDERWVHNLEHGGVVYLYRCPDDGCADELAALVKLAKGKPFALVMPYAALPTRFAAVAWGQRLLSECFDLAAFEAFYAAHADRAIESSTSGPPSGC